MIDNVSRPVWLITGCSSGFGREIALAALEAGAKVLVTARRVASVADICSDYPDQAIAHPLDVTDSLQVEDAVRAAIEHFGRIDVLVNNAGYGYVAAVEEGEESAVRAMFEANFFGALSMTREVLPQMRQQRSGRILNNSSQAGLMGNPGTGYYSASKFALEGLMEALAKEVSPLGIYVTSLAPGAFRTDWAGRSMQRPANSIPDYAEHVGARLDMIANFDGKQPGDPVRAAKIFVQVAKMDAPPTQLLLGKGLLDTYREKLGGVLASLETWENTTVSADFPQQEASDGR